jgi:hypothetical protein
LAATVAMGLIPQGTQAECQVTTFHYNKQFLVAPKKCRTYENKLKNKIDRKSNFFTPRQFFFQESAAMLKLKGKLTVIRMYCIIVYNLTINAIFSFWKTLIC